MTSRHPIRCAFALVTLVVLPLVARAQTLSPVRLLEPVPVDKLTVEAVIATVLERNPSLEQMQAAWQAASARYPQVTSADDPMFGGMFAPASFGSRATEPGYRLEVSQKLFWPAKRNLRGDAALADAAAAGHDVQDMRAQLVESARNAFHDYFLVHRSLAVNDEALRLLDEFRRNAETRFRTGLIPQQDILQADVEIGRQRERGITLDRMRKVAQARLNTLMHQEPARPLSAPPDTLPRPAPTPAAEQLVALAIAERPDLRSLESRIAADRAALALARIEYRPDVEISAAYDTIMGNGPMRDLAPQVGVRMNLPLRLGKRNAAVAEAQARLNHRCAELAVRVDQVKLGVQEAYEQVIESERILRLYEETILPAAEKNVQAAQSAYVTGKTPFLSLIEAQRSLIGVRDRNFEASAEYQRRRATLDRLVGQSIVAR